MEKLMEMDALLKFMKDHFMMEIGTWTPCTAKENFFGTLENALTMEILKMDKEQDTEFTQRELKLTLEKYKTANSMGKVDTFSTTQNHTRNKTKWFTKESLKIIKS